MADERDRASGRVVPAAPAVDIRVSRAGGVAGMRRAWAVESPDPSDWAPLVAACPWDDVPDAELTGADRLAWRIEVRAPEPPRTAELPERAVDGAWRTLVDRVRDEGRPVRPAPPAPRARRATRGGADG